jgi:hypothetical protein
MGGYDPDSETLSMLRFRVGSGRFEDVDGVVRYHVIVEYPDGSFDIMSQHDGRGWTDDEIAARTEAVRASVIAAIHGTAGVELLDVVDRYAPGDGAQP